MYFMLSPFALFDLVILDDVTISTFMFLPIFICEHLLYCSQATVYADVDYRSYQYISGCAHLIFLLPFVL